MNDCLKDQCRSPVACGGFGYCRERNLTPLNPLPGLYQYVAHEDVNTRHKDGWMIAANLGPRHGQHAVLMWHCDCGGQE